LGDNRLGGGRFSEKSGLPHVVLESIITSPYDDDDRDGVRGVTGYACEGDSGTAGDGGAMMPSGVRDDDRRILGTKPKSSRKSEERDRCPDGGKDATEGEFTAS